MTALLKGVLIIDTVGRCVTVDRAANDQQPIPVVFVDGSILVSGNEAHIVLPDGQRLMAGDTLEITGGSVDLESVADIEILAHLSVPETCWSPDETNRELWLVSPTTRSSYCRSRAHLQTVGLRRLRVRQWGFALKQDHTRHR